MGFYIEELPTELNGITMKEAVYWADIYLQDNPCDRMWDAMRALRDFYETVTSEAVEEADRKTEPTISKMEQVEDEPMTDCGDFANRLAYERGVKHAWEVAQKVFCSTVTFYEAEDVAKQIDKDINVRSKDEPTTQTETQNSNLTFENRTMRDCYNCKRYETEGECIECHYEPKDECAKEYEELGLKELKELIEADRKTEPQRDCFLCKWLGEVNVCGRCRSRNLFCEKEEPKTEPQICDTCRYYNSNIPCGSTPSACKEADKFAEEFVDGLKKLKPTSSKMEQVDKDINVRSKTEPQTITIEGKMSLNEWRKICPENPQFKDEPQTDCGDFADRLAYERGIKHAWEVAQKVFDSTLTFYKAEKELREYRQTEREGER